MQDSKLIKVLKSFSKEEIKVFRKFIDTPFFNKEGSYIVRFFDEIKKSYPVFTGKVIEKESIYKKLYPGKNFNDSTMRKLSSATLKLAEEYLRFISYNESGCFKDILYIKTLRERRLEKLFEPEAKKLDDDLNDPKEKIDSEYFRHRYRLELEKINYYLDFHSMLKQQQESLQKVQNYLVYDSLINLLDIGFNLMIGQTTMYKGEMNMVKHMIDNINFDELGKVMKADTPELYPIFELFYFRYMSINDINDDNLYYEYKKIALDTLYLLSWENQFTIFVSLQNNCTRRFIEGKRYFVTELHEVHKEMLERGLYVQKQADYMNLHTFRNIVLTATNLGNNDWTMDFLEKYRDRLLPEQRDSLEVWTRALVYYNLKKFDLALRELQSVKNDHFLTKHEIKALTMKIFYELEDYEPAISFAESYRKMVSNDNTYAEMHRNSYTNFCVFYMRLVKIAAGGNYDDLYQLKKDVEKNAANSKEWLIEKIDELMK